MKPWSKLDGVTTWYIISKRSFGVDENTFVRRIYFRTGIENGALGVCSKMRAKKKERLIRGHDWLPYPDGPCFKFT